MANLLFKRVKEGVMIDRAEQKLRGTRKNPKHIEVPDGLAKFFNSSVTKKDCR